MIAARPAGNAVLLSLILDVAVAKSLPDVAHDEGYAAVADQVASIAASTAGQRVAKALDGAGIGGLTLPVFFVFGADLSLSDASPLGRCAWDGSVVCHFDARGVGKADDYVPICKGAMGSTLALDAVADPTTDGRLGWRVSGVERCWHLDAVAIKVMPRPDRALDGIGQGDDPIPPELSQLTQAEVFAEIKRHEGELAWCSKKYPGGHGSLVVAFHIADDGTVGTAKIASSTFDQADVQWCVVERIKRIRFTPPMGGFQDGEYPMTLL